MQLRDERKLRSRSAFKLEQIDNKYKFLKPGKLVVDIGAAPGGWTQVAIERMKQKEIGKNKPAGDGIAPTTPPAAPRCQVVANDLLPFKSLPGCRFVQGDFTLEETQNDIQAIFNSKVDIVMSDMAPNGTGNKLADHFQQMELCFSALDFALNLLKRRPSSIFLCKVYQGEAEGEFIQTVRKFFIHHHRIKPDASRNISREFYLLGRGMR